MSKQISLSGSKQSSQEEKQINPPNIVERFFNPQTKPPEKPDVEYWTLAVHRLILLVAFATFVVAVITAVYGILLYQIEQEKNRNEAHLDAERIELALNEPRITLPPTGSSLGATGIVEGYSPYKDKNIYVLISVPDNNSEFLQSKAELSTNGLWRANVSYGNSNTQLPAIFYIRAIITTKSYVQGQNLPDDAIMTNSIFVNRVN